MAPRVGRIQVTVEIVDDDGTTTIHEATGEKWEHYTPSISLKPNYDDDGMPSIVTVQVDAVLSPIPGTPLLTVTEGVAPNTRVILSAEDRAAFDLR
jgi:hypothetical protein